MWLKGFHHRWSNMKTRRSEKLGAASANVTEANLRGWFRDVFVWMKDNNYEEMMNDPCRVFGADKTSFKLAPDSRPVVAEVGTANVYDAQAAGAMHALQFCIQMERAV